MFNILAVGDIVSECGVDFIRRNLWSIREKYAVDFVAANGENCAKYNGLSPDDADTLFTSGVDVITTGNHIWRKKEVYTYLDDTDAVLRPANYPPSCPGHGYAIIRADGIRVLCVNILGVVFMESLASPFDTLDAILEREKGAYDISVIDLHAEATSEKIAFARYFDGRCDVIFGTHTHVQTADICLLPKGTAYITDVGMTGAVDSVLGVAPECSIERFRTKMPVRFEPASGPVRMCGALFSYDTAKKAVTSCRLVTEDQQSLR